MQFSTQAEPDVPHYCGVHRWWSSEPCRACMPRPVAYETRRGAYESDLRSACESYLDLRELAGHLVWTRTDAGGRARGISVRAGWPDLTIVLASGRAVLVELKRADGKLRVAQKKLSARCADIGVKVHVVRSVLELITALGGRA